MNGAEQQYRDAVEGYREATSRGDGSAEKAGKQLREQALERADRREWAHKRRGDERRWSE